MSIPILLLLSKNGYTASFTSYYTFYLIERFHVTVQVSQLMLFLYLVIGALGVIVGGMIGDRIGRDRVIWLSILGSLPFALILPNADLFWTGILSVLISFIMASAFSAILIYAIDLVPHRVGLVGGLFYGLAFGLGGLAAAGLGVIADRVDCRGVPSLRLAAGLGTPYLSPAAQYCGRREMRQYVDIKRQNRSGCEVRRPTLTNSFGFRTVWACPRRRVGEDLGLGRRGRLSPSVPVFGKDVVP